MKFNQGVLGFITIVLLSSCGGGDSSPSPSYRLVTVNESVIPSNSISKVTKYFYSESGHVIRKEIDIGNDGITDDILTYEIGSNGKRNKHFYDDGADGVSEMTVNYIYDNSTRLEQFEFDLGDDGVIEDYRLFSYFPDNKISKKEFRNPGGLIYNTYEYTYDENGYIATESLTTWGYPIPTSYSISLNESGRPVSQTIDDDNDGIADRVVVYDYQEGACIVPEPISHNKIVCSYN